jgi:hypothetical protein
MLDRYFVQNVFRKTYSNGAVRHTYFKSHKCYVDLFEYEDQNGDRTRRARIEELQNQIIDELLKQYPPVVIFENGTWLHESPVEEIVYSYLEKFEDVGVAPEDEEPVRIERIQVRKEL